MPGMSVFFDRIAGDVAPDRAGPFNLSNSLTAFDGDVAVGTTVTGGEVRIRRLLQDDIDDLYQEGGNTVGVLGIFESNVTTDANGNLQQPSPATALAGGVANQYPVGSFAGFQPKDPVTGRPRDEFLTPRNAWAGSLWENTTIDETLIGVAVGLLISTITTGSIAIPFYFWSSAATTKIGRIQTVDEFSPYFNKAVTANVQDTTHYNRCPVIVTVLPSYRQLDTLFNYAD